MLQNQTSIKAAVFFLPIFVMMSGLARADGLLETEFFGGGFEEERGIKLEDSLEESKGYFVSNFDDLKISDSRFYASSPGKRERLKDFQNKLDLNRSYFKGMFSDLVHIASSPSRWDRTDWMTAGLVAAGTGFFIGMDEEIKDAFEDDSQSSTMDTFADIFEPFGNGAFTVPALAAFYIFGHFDENDKAKRTALIATESFLITGLYTTVLKVTFGRHRPSTGNSAVAFDGFTTDHKSFPSGHTSTAFAIATVIADEYEETPYINPISYGVATLTGLSRINDKKHWASDVFFGAALGYFTSKSVIRLHENKKGQHFTIYPRVDSHGGGLVLSKKF